jgi:hypothetical protein
MALVIKDAVKHALKARIGLLGPTGAGKTYTGLKFLFAMQKFGMVKKVGVIDTEHGSASKYVGEFPPFRVIELGDDYSPEIYVDAMKLLADDGCDGILIDSLTHAWVGKGGALEIKDKLGRSKGFNDYTAWGPVTAMQNRLIEALLNYPGHEVATMRLKMEYAMEKDANGKLTVRKIGLQPVQRDGMEYEFDLVGDLDQDHNFGVSKTRCSALDGYSERKPGEDVIVKLRAWLEGGTAATDRAQSKPAPAQSDPPAQPAPAATSTTGASMADHFAQCMTAASSVQELADLAGELAPFVEKGHVTAAERERLLELYAKREAELAASKSQPAAPATPPVQTFTRFAEEIRAARDETALLALAVQIGKAVSSGFVTDAERARLIAVYNEREDALRKAA